MRIIFYVIFFLIFLTHSAFAQPQHSLGAVMSGTDVILGMGFVYHDSATVVTCYHLVKHKPNLIYQPADNSSFYTLELTYVDTAHNIAVLKANTQVGIPLKIAFEDSIVLGQRIRYFGYDMQQGNEDDAVIMTGYSSLTAKGQMLEQQETIDFIEFRAKDIPGYEGSPVINDNGEVIAINMVANTIQGVRGNKKNLINKAYRMQLIER